MEIADDDFEPQLGRPPKDVRPRLAAVRAAVRAASIVGTQTTAARGGGVRAHFAKGSSQRSRPVHASSRRVVVKVRYAANSGGRGAPLRAHVRYLAREAKLDRPQPAAVEKKPEIGRTVDYLSRGQGDAGAGLRFYDRASEDVDARSVTQAWADDARHFRMIISAEDGAALGDLKPFVREVMSGLEVRMGQRLTWLAVDHHDTDNPHTHVLVRGKQADGRDLFIPSRLIASGIREQAQAIATRILGPRLDVDLAKERRTEIDLKGPTSLDRELVAHQGQILEAHRPDLAARLQRLEAWGLASRQPDGWRLANGLVSHLNDMAEHAEVERVAAGIRRGRETAVLLSADQDHPIVGELLHIAPADEFGDRFLAIIETGAGELRYAHFERAEELAVLDGAQRGAVVRIEPNRPAIRPSDEAVARIAARSNGAYSERIHREIEPGVPSGIMRANVRRLEAMRRFGLVTRSPDGTFGIASDHLDRVMTFERRLAVRAPFAAQVVSYLSLKEQVAARGPTLIDRVLAGEGEAIAGEGRFARAFRSAADRRRAFLMDQGWMGADEFNLSKSSLARLAKVEIKDLCSALSNELGVHVVTEQTSAVRGVYARRIDLAQGRMSLIVGESHAHLVPWRPVLERFAGREVEGLLRGQGLSWGLAHGGPPLPPM